MIAFPRFVLLFGLFGPNVLASDAARNVKIAIARTFSQNDASKLALSFDVWNEFPPCDGNPSYAADLVLAFSQSLDDSRLATDAIEAIASTFETSNGFGCFDRLIAFGCNIDPNLDQYKPDELDMNPLWVMGPNTQFRRTVRFVEKSDYDFMYLMEMDSIPLKPFWLDALIGELRETKDIAILGR
jgi:hypothetical protein